VKKIEEEPISYEKKLEKEQEIGVLKKKGKKKEKVFLAGGFKWLHKIDFITRAIRKRVKFENLKYVNKLKFF